MNFQGSILVQLPTGKGETPYKTVGMSAELYESIYGLSLYRVNLRMHSITDWNNVVKDSGLTDCKLQWGRCSDGGGQPVLSAWRTCRLQNYTADALYDGVNIKADFVDGMFRMTKRCPRVMFKKKTVSGMVKEIIEANKLTADVDEFSTAEYSLVQCGMSDYEFIKDVLIPRASEEPVLFFTRAGNTISLKQRKRQAPSVEFNPLFIVPSDTQVPISEFKTSSVINDTNFGVLGVAFDPLKGQKEPFSQEFLASDSTMDKDPFVVNPPKSLNQSVTEAGRVNNIVVETLGLDLKTALKERIRPEFTMNTNRVAVISYLLPVLELGATAKLVTCAFEGDGRNQKVIVQGTGEYLVYAMYHTISPTDVTTITFLERRGVETK